jgi:hypothetical protein
MDQPTLLRRHEQGVPSYSTEPDPCDALPEDAKATSSPSRGGKGRTALLWGVGSTVLSALGFIAFALFEQYNSGLCELRNDLKHFNEAYGAFVQKDNFQKFREKVREQFKELRTAGVVKAQLQQELRACEKAREEMAHELQRIRERLAFVEGQHSMASNGRQPSTGTK